MKKILLLFAVISLLAVTNVSAQSSLPGNPIDLNGYPTSGPGGGNPSGSDNGHPRGPVLMPEASINNYTLYLCVGFDFTLQLIDSDDNVVYSTFVFANTPSVVLPSYIEGELELRLVTNDYYYFGFINL